MGWLGVDFDGTLAVYDRNFKPLEFGHPVPKMVECVKAELAKGREVRIFTARVSRSEVDEQNIAAQIRWAAKYGEKMTREQAINKITEWNNLIPLIELGIQAWCIEHLGCALAVTAQKDFEMESLWDDRCRRVIFNTGEFCCEEGML